MKCVSPINIKDPRKLRAGLRLTVPCGKCGACKSNRRAEWSFRLGEEFENSKNGRFLTLTYSDENITYGDLPSLNKRDLQLFFKRLRKASAKICNWRIRYYAVGEYGTDTERPHYHALVFNLHPDLWDRIDSIWGLGHVVVGDVTDKSIHYTTKYHVNYDKGASKDKGRAPEFATMSGAGKTAGGIGYQ